MKTKIVGCFGGTFDPPHLGHVNLLNFVATQLDCGTIKVLPCHIPAHKSPETPVQDRVNMCMFMQREYDFIDIDLREIESDRVSYTVNTLAELKQESPNETLCFIIGMDSFLTLTTWFEWPKLFELANIIVVGRQSDELQSNYAFDVKRQTNTDKQVLKIATQRLKVTSKPDTDKSAFNNDSNSSENIDITPVSIDQCKQILDNTPNGCLVFMNNPFFNVSSTDVRERLRNGKETTEFLLPTVAAYIAERGLYPSSKGEN